MKIIHPTSFPPSVHAARPGRFRWSLACIAALMFAARPVAAEPLEPCPHAHNDRARQCLDGAVKEVVVTTTKFRRTEAGWVEEDAPKLAWAFPSTTFDRRGNLAERHEYETDGTLRAEMVYLYDTGGRRREVLTFAPDGALQARTVIGYDARGRKTGEERFDGEGTKRVTVEYAYDVMGRLIEESVSRATGEFVLKWVYSYNDAGDRTRDAMYTASGMMLPGPATRSYTYDDTQPTPVEEYVFDASGTLLDRFVYRCDARGNRSEELRYDPDGFLLGQTVFEYEFDDAGNWIKRTRLRKFGNLSVRPIDVTYRTIEYYEPLASRQR